MLEALFGDITKVTLLDTLSTVVISVLIIMAMRHYYNRIILSLISEELARSTGVNVRRVNLVYLLLVTLVVAMGIKIAGTLLVGALVIIPAAAAENISPNLSYYYVLSSTIGVVSVSAGILLSRYFGLPAGPPIVIFGTTIFVLTLVAGRMISGK